MGDKDHVKIRNEVNSFLQKGVSIEKIAEILKIPIGTRYLKRTVRWYLCCIRAKENQKKAIEKHPNLYSKAGKIAHQKHPWIGKELGRKYGPIQGKKNAERLKGNKEYFSMMAKKLQEKNPNHSVHNMKKAHETMKKLGNFNEHQRLAALKCMEKNPNQLKEMSKKAHKLYSLGLLALESRRKNYPYRFMGCLFDSNQERILCKKFVEKGIIKEPIEKVNVHFRIGKCHIDFFIKNKVFIEFHPPRTFGKTIETADSYFQKRRKLLDENGFKDYPLVLIENLTNIENKLNEISRLTRFLHN